MAVICSADSHLLPLLETLEDSTTSHTEQTDAYLSIANRLSGEDGKEFSVLVGGQFSRLCKAFKGHISNQNSDLSNAALQALGFCLFNNKIASGLSASETEELLSALNCIAVKAADKNTCTRALWVISKQNFPSEEVEKLVPSILSTLESVLNKDVQSLVIEYEALNVVIRLLEQVPTQMTHEAVRWSKLIIPLVVHSAPKVRLRAATSLEIGLPFLLQKQQEVSALTEQLMTSKLVAELQKLFSTKNETYVLKLWPLFVKLLGKTLHRSGSFINSLLQLEELGFRSGSPAVKKIAFIAWKSLIDNFASNPDILCSTKRLKLLMQPLSSIHVRTEALALTKIEVWWYLLMRLGSQLPSHFEQVCLPLLQSALSVEFSSAPATPLRTNNQSMAASTPLQKGSLPFGSPATPKISLNSSLLTSIAFPSVHLLGIEMLLHFMLGPEVVSFAAQHRVVLSLEPLQHPLVSNSSFFCKHAATLLNAVQDGFITIGKDAADAVLNAVWKDMIVFTKAAIDTGNKRERQGSEVLTHLLQALKNIVTSDALQVEKTVSLLEHTIKGLPQKVLGSAAYQVANMDLLNGTPALFLIQLHFHTGLLEKSVTGERFFINFETLVNYALTGPTSPLAFSEAVLGEINQNAKFIENKEHLWRMWSILINPLTERINQTNEVNQGDALEHNFRAVHSALMLPITHIFPVTVFPQPTMKTLLRTWSELYKVFARCAALVATVEENVWCEELCSRILVVLGDLSLNLAMLERIVHVITVIFENFNFSPYTTKFQPKTRTPHTPTDWAKKKREPLGNLNSMLKLLVKLIESFHSLGLEESQLEANAPSLMSTGGSLIGVLSTCICHITLPSVIRTIFTMITKPLSLLIKKTQSESNKVYNGLNSKLEKLLGDVIVCLGSRFSGPYDSDLLETLSPILCLLFLHKNKQTRNQAAQFWNGSFAKATMLTYPEELKPVLSQVKSKTPLLLPGFTFLSEDLSGPHSENTDNSQLEAKISGMEVRSTGKRDSLLARVEETKDKGTPPRPTQAKLKLDFSSPKPKEKLLDEERSVDFVFIPPEAKERVLTEHQKEVLRTKRVDIPTMYNNLDASQDTTLFTQYTQSQENSSEMPTLAEQEEKEPEPKENVPEVLPNENDSSKETKQKDGEHDDDNILDCKRAQTGSIDASAVGETNTDVQNTSNISNSSTSSDMVLGTPPPPVSRRQSFITLEKFNSSMSRSLSPLSNTKFPKAAEVILVPDSQEALVIENAQAAQEKKNMETKASKTEVSKPISKRGRKPKSSLVPEKTEDVKVNSSSESQNKASDAERPENKDWVPDSQTQVLESEVAETVKENNIAKENAEYKENTPPETIHLANSEKSQIPQAISNQVSLRRSSRRQSEILEGVKSIASDKGQKQQRDKVDKMQEKDGLNHDKKDLSETDLGKKVRAATDKQGDEQGESQEMGRSRTRYQTRRSSQGLVLASENSESDNSETREESTKRKRSWRGKIKSIEKDDNVNNSSALLQENGPKKQKSLEKNNLESGSEMETEVDHSTTKDISSKTYTLIADSTVSDANVCAEVNGTVSEPVKETNKTYDITKGSSQLQSLMTEPTAGDYSTAVSEVFQQSESNLQVSDCFHKRSKRARRSKSCDCCGDASNNKEATYTVLNSSVKPDLIPKKGHSSIVASEMSDTPFDETVFLGPFAVSTPLVGTKDQCFFKPSVTELKSDTESEQENTVIPLNEETKSEVEEITQIFVGTKTVEAPEESMEMVENVEASGEAIKVPKQNIESPEETVEALENEEAPKESKEILEEPMEFLVEKIEASEGTMVTPEEKVEALDKTEVSEGTMVTPEQNVETLDKTEASEGTMVTPEEKVEALDKTEASEGTMVTREQNVEALAKATEIPVDSVKPDVAETVENEISEQTIAQGKDSDAEFAQQIRDEDKENYVPLENDCIRQLNVTEDIVETKAATASANIDPEMAVASAENNTDEDPLLKPESSHCLQFVDCSSTDVRKETVEDEVFVASEKCAVPDVPENMAMEDKSTEGRADTDSPPKVKGLINFTLANDSPGGNSCWSPSASPSTSILKKGVKRQQENDSPSPLNKIRRVSFANPIYQEGLADDIDRRSPVVRCSSSNNSPSSRSLKLLTSNQPKHNTTPTKGFVSPSSRVLGFKSSKKNLISEMTKESMPSPKESVYPALMNCTTPVDVILPQITSLAWARGLGQLIRAKNIKTIGDLSILTPPEIKALPIRSPKVSTVKKALRVYHEQQTKNKGFDEFALLDEIEKPLNVLEEKTASIDEEKLATVLAELPTPAMDTAPSPDLLSQIAALSRQLSSEDLGKYSASQLFDIQEKLGGMSNCIIRHLQSRWRSPPHENSV